MNRILNADGTWYKRNGTNGSNVANKPLWTPSAITTALWLDASDSSTITIATGVSQWNDKSGNSRNATQATGSAQPSVISASLNGLNVVRFDGSNDRLDFNGSFFVNTSYTLYAMLVRRTSNGVYWMTGSTASTNQNLIVGWGNGELQLYAQYANDISATIPTYTTPIGDMYGYILNTALGRYMYKDGTLIASSGTTSAITSYTGSNLGQYTIGNTWYNGDIAEVVATTTALSTTDRQKLEGYLAWKWGRTSALPSDHPYKNSQPTV